jgi:aconitate hydratase
VPPGTGICHQVNLEYLAQVVWTKQGRQGPTIAYPDTLVGTDSHTTMVNGLAVLGWGVGGIEAEAAMLGQAQPMVIPEVVGFKLTGKPKRRCDGDRPRADCHADAAQEGRGQQVRRILRRRPRRPAAGRSRHHRQHGAGIRRDLRLLPGRRRSRSRYIKTTNRGPARIKLVEAYAKKQGPVAFAEEVAGSGLHRHARRWTSATIVPSAGRPQAPAGSRAAGTEAATRSSSPTLENRIRPQGRPSRSACKCRAPGTDYDLGHGDVVIAAITSCTNTSNPYVMLGAGLVARKAVKHWAEGQAVGQDLAGAGLARS